MASNSKPNGGIIYLITNLVNGKYYVGQTSSIRLRRNQHFYSANKGNFPINRAIRKYGRNNFIFEELTTASTQADLDNLEASWIITLSAHLQKFGYNRRLGGGGSSCNEEMRRAQSEAAKKRLPVWGPHNPMPLEHRQKLAEASRRRKGTPSPFKGITGRYSEETLKKISESGKGRPSAMKGGRWSAETRAKLGGRKTSEESRRKMSEAKKGKPGTRMGQPVSSETRATIRAAWQQKLADGYTAPMRSPEFCRSISERQKGKPRPQMKGRKRPDTSERLKTLYATPEGIEMAKRAYANGLGLLTKEQLSAAGKKNAGRKRPDNAARNRTMAEQGRNA